MWLLGMLLLLLPRLIDVNAYIDSDEASSVLLASNHFGDFIAKALKDRPHPPLHVLFLHTLAQLRLDTALLGRLVGIAGSIAGFGLMARMILRETTSTVIMISSMLMFAFSSYFLYLSTTIRPYSLIIPLGCAQLYFFISMLGAARESGQKISSADARLRGWLIFSILLTCTQYLSVPVTGTEFILLTTVLNRQALVRAIVLPGLAVLALAIWYYLGSLNSPSLTATWWVTEKPDAREYIYTLLTFFGAAPASALWLGAVLALVYLNALRQWRLLTACDGALAAVALVPTLAVFLLSSLGPLNIFAQRQLIVPAVALVVLTCALTRLMRRPWQMSCLVLIVAWAASSLPMGLPRYSKPPLAQMAASFARHGVKLVYTTSWEYSGLRYYGGRRFEVVALSPPLAVPGGEPSGEVGFVCRPGKCDAIASFIRASGLRVCGQRFRWNMVNYALAGEVLVFLPAAATLRAGDTCDASLLPANAGIPHSATSAAR